MTITKQQIVDGVVKYAKNEVVNKITDRPLKMLIAAAVSALELNPDLADVILRNEHIAGIMHRDGDQYDVENVFKIVEKTMEEYGDFSVVIPAIRFIVPEPKEMTFTAGDVRKLKKYLFGGESGD